MDGYDEDNIGNMIIEMVMIMVVAMRKKRQWGSGTIT